MPTIQTSNYMLVNYFIQSTHSIYVYFHVLRKKMGVFKLWTPSVVQKTQGPLSLKYRNSFHDTNQTSECFIRGKTQLLITLTALL